MSALLSLRYWLFFALVSSLLPVHVASAQSSESYEGPPSVLVNLVNATVEMVLDSDAQNDPSAAQQVSYNWGSLVIYTLADAVSYKAREKTIHDLECMPLTLEIGRRDKQLEAPPKSGKSTSLVEKAAIPTLLGLIWQTGTVQGEIEGSKLTFSSSLYGAFVTPFAPNREVGYQRLDWMRRLGFGLTFSLKEGKDDDLVTTNDLQAVSGKLVLIGDRSIRSKAFRRGWEKNVKPHLQRSVNETSRQLHEFSRTAPSSFMDRIDEIADLLATEVGEFLSANKSMPRESKAKQLREIILSRLFVDLFTPVREGTLDPGQEAKDNLLDELLPSIESENKHWKQAHDAVQRLLDELETSPMFTLSYNYVRGNDESDISEFRFIYDQPIAGNTLLANAFVSLYHDPDDLLGQEDVQDFGAALSWQRKIEGMWAPKKGIPSPPVVISLDVAMSYIEDSDDVEVIGQLRFGVPLSRAFQLPASLSYASRTDTSDEPEFRVNIGIGFDGDVMQALKETRWDWW